MIAREPLYDAEKPLLVPALEQSYAVLFRTRQAAETRTTTSMQSKEKTVGFKLVYTG